MNRLALRTIHVGLLGLVVLGMTGCGVSNKLRHYDFTGQSAAVLAAIPPRPLIFTSQEDAWVSLRHPVRSALRVGTAIVKQAELEQAQQRLDSAFRYVDVTERMAARSLALNAPYIGYEPVSDPRAADFLMDVRVYEYGIWADSWDNSTYFLVEGDLLLIDNHSKEVIWKQRIQERELITDTLFGLGVTVGNVLTARTLSRLSEEEMILGLENLADHAAQQISYKLQRDYAKSRRKR